MLQDGDKAPDFKLVAPDLAIESLDDYARRVIVVSIIPSVQSKACAAQIRALEHYCGTLGAEIACVTISADLPNEQMRWAEQAKSTRMRFLSTHRDLKVARDYGVLDGQGWIAQRALFVIDRQRMVRYAEYLEVNGPHPDYAAVLEVIERVV